MKQEFIAFKAEMDEWVKEFNSQLSTIKNIQPMIEENSQNTDHNYELIQELRTELRLLKEEVSALRMLQYLSIKTQTEKTAKH